MKKLHQLKYLFLLFALINTSCSDILNIDSENTTSPKNFIQDRQSAKNILATAYVCTRRALISNSAWLAYTDLRSNHLKMNNTAGIFLAKQYLNAPIDQLQQICSWDNFLETIYQCNLLIENIKNAEEYLTKDELNSMIGQAYFLRGFMHFYMTQIWGDCPLILSTKNASEISRKPVSEVLAMIIDDAEKAFDLLPLFYTDINGNNDLKKSVQYANKIAAAILLQKANMAIYNYQEVIHAYELLNLINKNKEYEFESGKSRTSIFSGDSKESVFGLALSGNDYTYPIYSPFNNIVFFKGQNLTLVQVASSEKVISLYSEKDIRLKSFFNVKDDTIITEFLKYSSSYQLFLRLSEAELLASEAYFRMGNENKALKIINAIKVRNDLDEIEADGDDLWNEIKDEFERELFGEGKLFFEWIRWGVLSKKIDSITEEQVINGFAFWPIAEKCILNNPGLYQNSFWLNN